MCNQVDRLPGISSFEVCITPWNHVDICASSRTGGISRRDFPVFRNPLCNPPIIPNECRLYNIWHDVIFALQGKDDSNLGPKVSCFLGI